jgi:hypothetical protein
MDVHSNSWDDNLINQLFLPIEAQKILQIPIMDKAYNDVLTWPGTLDGNYTVKTGYKAIMEWAQNSNSDLPSSSGLSTDIWDKLWQLNWCLLNRATSYGESLMGLSQSRKIYFKKGSGVTLYAPDVIAMLKL